MQTQGLSYHQAFVQMTGAKKVLGFFCFSVERKLDPDREPGAGLGPEQTGEPGARCEAPRSHLQRRPWETADGKISYIYLPTVSV